MRGKKSIYLRETKLLIAVARYTQSRERRVFLGKNSMRLVVRSRGGGRGGLRFDELISRGEDGRGERKQGCKPEGGKTHFQSLSLEQKLGGDIIGEGGTHKGEVEHISFHCLSFRKGIQRGSPRSNSKGFVQKAS